ncbi:crotonase/enoyl-CoA hydratase family protein [Antrihabitans stalactiti]|uniref:Probable enoyl-CoA hydratase EchA17 n=1 Tax=Antrihabitans stalactiti TaxID=2584121 RepID=A0A848KCU2_9NOCA|nr:crotonase/enoyl-CoA hydratase family protein [Antrihabitans stalactiti]NMN96703.1 crotonase/enoyl-CoA hydratase family protein [Antrihabitans stalactiti]
MTDDPTEPVVLTRDAHTLVITINRPAARNAIDRAVTVAIGDALEAAENDRDIRAVVLTGAGEKSFCAGADLKAIARGEAIVPTDGPRAAWGFAGYVSHRISKPAIAAVNGVALGGGTELVLASDIAVASADALFGLPEVKRGIIAGAGGVFRLPQQIPPKIALELMFTGEPISAQRALTLGLINRVTAPDRVLDEALALARTIAANAPLAVQASKRIAKHIVDGTITAESASWELSARERAVVRSSADAQEGPRAFAEKREPVWTGR